MTPSSKTVVAVLDDLFFTVKIADAAKRADLQVIFCKTEDAALERVREQPLLLVIDLNCKSIDSVQFVSKLKSGEFQSLPVIGFVSHVQVELRQQAQAAGCDTVLARSAFSTNFPQILRRHAGLTA